MILLCCTFGVYVATYTDRDGECWCGDDGGQFMVFGEGQQIIGISDGDDDSDGDGDSDDDGDIDSDSDGDGWICDDHKIRC